MDMEMNVCVQVETKVICTLHRPLPQQEKYLKYLLLVLKICSVMPTCVVYIFPYDATVAWGMTECLIESLKVLYHLQCLSSKSAIALN